MNMQKSNRGSNFGPKGDLKEDLLRTLVHTTVMTQYNKRTYQIDDIDFNLSPNDEFTLANGEKTSYRKYYKDKYGEEIKEPDQPLLLAKNRRSGAKISLIPELCLMTGLSES